MRRTWVVAALLVATSVPGTTGTAGAAPCGRPAAERARTWFVSDVPLPEQGPAREAFGLAERVRAFAVDPGNGRTVFVSDGAILSRSDDGGCTWSSVWSLGVEDAPTEITAIDVARVGGKPRVLLTVFTANPPFPGRVARTRIVRSDDGRAGWRAVYDELGHVPPEGARRGPTVRSGAGGVAYAFVPGPAGMRYVRSADATTWEARTPIAELEAPFSILGLAVSPWNPDEVWEWGGAWTLRPLLPPTGLRRSVDGGRTWEQVDPWKMVGGRPPTVTVDIAWPRRGGPARIVAVGGASAATDPDTELKIAWSGDGGATFALAVPPKRVGMASGGVTHTPRGDVVIVTPSGVVYRLPHTGRVPRREEWRTLAPLPHPLTTERTSITAELARATATSPAVVVVPTYTRLQLLTVAP